MLSNVHPTLPSLTQTLPALVTRVSLDQIARKILMTANQTHAKMVEFVPTKARVSFSAIALMDLVVSGVKTLCALVRVRMEACVLSSMVVLPAGVCWDLKALLAKVRDVHYFSLS